MEENQRKIKRFTKILKCKITLLKKYKNEKMPTPTLCSKMLMPLHIFKCKYNLVTPTPRIN